MKRGQVRRKCYRIQTDRQARTRVRVKCLLNDWPQCDISCDYTAVTFSLLQQNAHYMLELVGLSKLWKKLLCI